MKKANEVICTVVDHGLFLPIALELGRHFKKVFYWTPADTMSPKIAEGIIGDGFEEIERVSSPWGVDADLYVFPDIGFHGLQNQLQLNGKAVWGHNGGDVLEVNRGRFLQTLQDLEMDVPHYETIYGMTALCNYLREAEDKYIKVSRYRGDWETLHFRNWAMDESTLDQYAYRLGPAKELFTFYVFDAIDTDIEDGCDTYCIDGQFPSLCLHGMERKDKSYLGAVQAASKLPSQLREVNDKFSPVLSEFGYRSFFTSEVRIKDDKSYFIDPTCRAASPPSQLMTNLYMNLADIIWQGANGVCIDPEPAGKFGVQALIHTDRDREEWTVLDLDPDVADFVKCGFACRIDGRIVIPPHPLGDHLGWLVATGGTIKETIENLKDLATMLPDGVECETESLSHLLIEAEKAKAEGVELARNIPEPATAIDE